MTYVLYMYDALSILFVLFVPVISFVLMSQKDKKDIECEKQTGTHICFIIPNDANEPIVNNYQ